MAKWNRSSIFILALVMILSAGLPCVVSADWPLDPTENIPICTASDDQRGPQIISDGAGGAIIVWCDDRNGISDIYAQRVDVSGNVLWTDNGVAICTAVDDQWAPQLVSDGSGGAIITWRDGRSGWDIYAQRVDSSGHTLWAENGVAICTVSAGQLYPQIASDGEGGAIITWRDNRISISDFNIYAQRVDASGNTLWTVDGVPVCTAVDDQGAPKLVSDGVGGAIITWCDDRNGSTNQDIYAQRVDAAGYILWTPDGVAVCTTNHIQLYPQLASDGSGGAIITWLDRHSGEGHIYAQRVDASGETLWMDNGIAICTASDYQSSPQLVSDGSDGVIIVWADGRDFNGNIYAQRLDASGNLLWTAYGAPVYVEGSSLSDPRLVSDGSGGAIIAWIDWRIGKWDRDIYAQRVDASGNLLWTTDGVPVCTAIGNQSEHQLLADGSGGAVITWSDKRSEDSDIYAQWVGTPSPWSVETIPGLKRMLLAPGTDISDLAVAGDNTTMYATDREAKKIYKSTNAGMTWIELRNPDDADEPQLIAVAPDDPDFVAVVADDNELYLCCSGGGLWDYLSENLVQAEGGAPAQKLYDIAISESYRGINYIAVAGSETGPLANVWYYPYGVWWAEWKETNELPGFASTTSDRAVAVDLFIASDIASRLFVTVVTEEDDGGTGTDYVRLEILKIHTDHWSESDWNASAGFPGYPAVIVSDDGIMGIDSASISLAANYNVNDPAERLGLVGLTVAGDDDAAEQSGLYRLIDTSITQMLSGSIHSVAINSHYPNYPRAVAGEHDSNEVHFNMSGWHTMGLQCTKLEDRPSGENRTLVRWAGSTVVAGTSGDTSAFSVSDDKGESFTTKGLSSAGTDVSDLAVASDNITFYATDREADKIYKSSDNGTSWAELSRPAGADEPQLVAVAPDNADIVAFVADDNKVYMSIDGGTSFDDLGAAGDAVNVNDIAISPTAAGIHYIAVAGRDGAAGTDNCSIHYYDLGAATPVWTDAVDDAAWTGPAAGPDEFYAVAFSPNFDVDSIMLAVAGNNGTNGEVTLHVASFNQNEWDNELWGDYGEYRYYPLVLENESIAGSSIRCNSADIAVDTAYLGNNNSTHKVFIAASITDNVTDTITEVGGIYWLYYWGKRVRQYLVGKSMNSIAWDGRNLVAGEYNTNIIWRYPGALTATPSHFLSCHSSKRPSGTEKVNVAWAGKSTVVAGTSGDESAFSRSTEYGYRFNDISLIDTTLDILEDVAVSADGSRIYLVTNDGTDTSLWRKKDGTWQRILLLDNSNGYLVRTRTVASGADVIYVADTGGATIHLNTHVVPSVCPSDDPDCTGGSVTEVNPYPTYISNSTCNIADLAIESENVTYIAASDNDTVIKTTDAGWHWDSGVSTNLPEGNCHTIRSIVKDGVVVGSTTGYVAYSTDASISWTPISEQIEPGALLAQVIANGLSKGDYIFATSSKPDGKVVRWQIGISTEWEDMEAPVSDGYGVYGIELYNGALCVLTSDNTSNSELLRALNHVSGAVTWNNLGSVAETFTRQPSALKVSTGNTKLWAIGTAGNKLYSLTDNILSVTTNAATNVTTSSAQLNGNLNSLGEAVTANVSFEWGETRGGPYPNSTTPEMMTTTGTFSANISGLGPGATYFFRAVATTDGVTIFGDEIEFTTSIVCYGDVNGDGEINIFDMTKVARIILEMDNPTLGADANQDGSINIFDITKIARIILQIDPHPCP